MFVVDDAVMALILRFVVNNDDMDSPDNEFLKRQIKTLRKYLAQFPDEEHGTRAIEWIGQHAARYRRDWERSTVASRISRFVRPTMRCDQPRSHCLLLGNPDPFITRNSRTALCWSRTKTTVQRHHRRACG